MRHLFTRLGVTFLLIAFAATAIAATPDPPDRLNYQGVLLDDLGAPRTGSVDITVRVFDAVSAGSKIYVELFQSVPLSDGVFTIELGPTGEATDQGDDPLATSLSEALAGDLSGTSNDRFIELQVGTETALSRTQILTVPYAMRADEAGHADTANVAVSAMETTMVNGLPSSVMSEIYEHTNLDGQGPGNADPQEGFGDTDGDGIANFVDPDNDDDGLLDGTEISQGTNMNLPTPKITGVVPPAGRHDLSHVVTVQGSGFGAGMTVDVGSQSVTPTNVTTNSFDVTLAPEPENTTPVTVTVTRANGETDTGGGYFFTGLLFHGIKPASEDYFSFDITGSEDFAIGSEGDDYWAGGATHSFPTSDGNGVGTTGQMAVAFAPNGDLVGLRCRNTGGTDCDVEYAVDSDGDFELTDETGLAFDTPTNGRIRAPGITFDPSGNVVLAYHKFEVTFGYVAMIAHDRDGNGDFTGTNELATLTFPSGIQQTNAEVAVDSSGRVAYAYRNNFSGGISVGWDRSGDGDFDDTVDGNPEISLIPTGTDIDCLGLAFSPSGELVLVYSTFGLLMARDGNGDGDFSDSGETTTLVSQSVSACDVTGDSDIAVAYSQGTGVVGLVDRNDDGDFTDPTESFTLSTAGSLTSLRVGQNDVGKVFVPKNGEMLGEPTP